MKIDPATKSQFRADMLAELERVPEGHTCRGWNAWLQGRAEQVYSILMTWRVADRLRRKLVEELQERGVIVVSVKRRVFLWRGDAETAKEAARLHFSQAMGHIRAARRIRGLAPEAFREEVYRELEPLFLAAEEGE